MTKREKLGQLLEICDEYPGCEGCPYDKDESFWCHPWNEIDVPDEEVDKSYEKAFPSGTEKTENTEDIINRPKHYNREGGMECLDEMELIFGREALKHFCLCNAWKYRYRASAKNGDEDLKKSDFYMKKYKELSAND